MKLQYIRSERAHYMCPNMHFGICFTLRGRIEPNEIRQTLERLAAARPFLRALVSQEAGTQALFYAVTGQSTVQYVPLEDARAVRQAWSQIAGTQWNVYYEGLLRVFSCPTADGTMLLFAAHHLLTDGRGLLQLCGAFADCLAGAEGPELAAEQLITSIDDLPPGSDLAPISRFLVNRAGRQWRRENHTISYEDYLAFSAAYGASHPVSYRFDQMDEPSLTVLQAQCRAAGVSINDWLMAQVYLRTGTEKVILAADIRDCLSGYQSGALGNYSTAMSIVCRKKTTDPMALAKQVHTITQKALSNAQKKMLVLACYLRMEPTLLDAAAIAALGGFDSKAARFVGGGMFGFAKPAAYSITNLGAFSNDRMTFAAFIPPASPAAHATIGVLTLNGVMRTVTSVNSVDNPA